MSSSAAATATAKKKKTSKSKQPVRVLIRCSWSGARHPVPSPLPSSGDPVSLSTRLSDLVGSIRSNLPPAVFEGESTVVYLRKCVGRHEWGATKLSDLGVGDDGAGGAGVLLTLNLPGVAGSGGGANPAGTSAVSAAWVAATTTGMVAASEVAKDAPPPAPIPPCPAPVAAPFAPADPQPMDVDPTPKTLTTPCKSPSEAIELLLSSNFDADSRDSALTLLKIVDNVLSKPSDPKVRTIRLANPAIEKKIVSHRGALDFLLTVGFAAKPPAIPLLSGAVGGIGGGDGEREVEFIELTERNEDAARILDARKLLASKAMNVLGVDASDLPKLRTPPPLTAAASHSSGAAASNRPGGEFNPYKAHSYNTQVAATGAADPHSVTPGSDGQYVSKTEKELGALKAKQARLEKRMQKLEDRGLVATRPGQVGNIVTLPSGDDDFASASGSGSGGGKGDGALLAARMKRMEEERKKREEGGFTTKAMRDLEKMKKARVYSHATVRVSFPDGCALTAKFLPNERVRDVRDAVMEAVLEDLRGGLSGFDLYVTPPRRTLDNSKKLEEEGLVPAAKVFVSWKVGAGPPKGWEAGAYIRPELFAAPAEAFPDAKKLVDAGSSKKQAGGAAKGSGGNKGNGGRDDPKSSREEELMKRMMGGPKGLFGKLGGGKRKGSGGCGKDGKWV